MLFRSVDNQGIEIKNEGFDYNLIFVPAMHLAATKIKESRSANIILLGVLNQTLELWKDKDFEEVIRKTIPKASEINIEAYRLGINFITSPLKQSH